MTVDPRATIDSSTGYFFGVNSGITIHVGWEPIRGEQYAGLLTNNSNVPIPYKHEDGQKIIYCQPGESCDADGVYPVDLKQNPVKIVDGCSGTVRANGELAVSCVNHPLSYLMQSRIIEPLLAPVRRHVYSDIPESGGQILDDFFVRHRDWPLPPNR